MPRHDSSSTEFSGEESEPTLTAVRCATGSMAKLDVSFGSMSIFGAMIPWIGTGESGGDAAGDGDKEAFFALRGGCEDDSFVHT